MYCGFVEMIQRGFLVLFKGSLNPGIDRIRCRSLISRGEPLVLSSHFVKPIILPS
jgi:hypothetical protein